MNDVPFDLDKILKELLTSVNISKSEPRKHFFFQFSMLRNGQQVQECSPALMRACCEMEKHAPGLLKARVTQTLQRHLEKEE